MAVAEQRNKANLHGFFMKRGAVGQIPILSSLIFNAMTGSESCPTRESAVTFLINNVEALARGIHATSVAVEERRDSGFSPLS